jgi:hypothetical protein
MLPFISAETWKTLEDHEIKIAAYALRNGAIQVSEAARLTGRTWHTSKKDLDRLVRRDILTFVPGNSLVIRRRLTTLKRQRMEDEVTELEVCWHSYPAPPPRPTRSNAFLLAPLPRRGCYHCREFGSLPAGS